LNLRLILSRALTNRGCGLKTADCRFHRERGLPRPSSDRLGAPLEGLGDGAGAGRDCTWGAGVNEGAGDGLGRLMDGAAGAGRGAKLGAGAGV
jgi:hypothetical protein